MVLRMACCMWSCPASVINTRLRWMGSPIAVRLLTGRHAAFRCWLTCGLHCQLARQMLATEQQASVWAAPAACMHVLMLALHGAVYTGVPYRSQPVAWGIVQWFWSPPGHGLGCCPLAICVFVASVVVVRASELCCVSKYLVQLSVTVCT